MNNFKFLGIKINFLKRPKKSFMTSEEIMCYGKMQKISQNFVFLTIKIKPITEKFSPNSRNGLNLICFWIILFEALLYDQIGHFCGWFKSPYNFGCWKWYFNVQTLMYADFSKEIGFPNKTKSHNFHNKINFLKFFILVTIFKKKFCQ